MTIVIPNWNYLSTSQGIEGLLPVAAETPWEEPTPASSHGTMIDEDVMIQWWICNNVLIICNVYVCILYIYYIYIVYTRVLSLYMYNSDVCICIQYTSIRCIVPRSYTFGHGKSPSGSLDIWTWLHGEVSGSFHCQVGIWVMFSKVYRIHYPFIQIGPLASINPFSFFLRVRPFMLHWFLRTRVMDIIQLWITKELHALLQSWLSHCRAKKLYIGNWRTDLQSNAIISQALKAYHSICEDNVG